MKKAAKRTMILILSAFTCIVLLLCSSLFFTVHADNNKSITLICTIGEENIAEIKWKLYRVGERKNGEFVLTGDFAAYPVDLKDMSATNVSGAAQTLASYAVADRIAVISEGFTDNNGSVTFSGLDNGLYLAVGSRSIQDPFVYIPAPLFIEVSSNSQDLTFKAYPKIERITYSNERVTYTVKKVWIDNDNAFDSRPTYVTVDFYMDDKLYDTVTLTEDNNWENSWSDLDPNHEWHVIERMIPVGYEVRIEFNQSQYLIRNRHININHWGDVTQPTTSSTTTVSTTTTTADTTTSSDTTTSDDIKVTSASQTTTSNKTTTGKTTTKPPSDTGSKEKLPQTGQLWWPLLPLSLGGILMIFIGVKIKTKKGNNEK